MIEVSLSEYLVTVNCVLINDARNEISFDLKNAVPHRSRHDNAQFLGDSLNNFCYVFINYRFKSKEENRVEELLEIISTEVHYSSLYSTENSLVQR